MTDQLVLPEVDRIAVLRGGALGDLVMALPAMAALRTAYPRASLTLLGTAQHARLLAGRRRPVDDVLVLPTGDRGAFMERARGRGFDLAIQLHGGGRWSNEFLLGIGARCTVGSRTPDAAAPQRWVPFRYYQHETLRALEVVSLVGASTTHLAPELTVLAEELVVADRALHGLPRPVLAVHPGATDPRRRWPADRFAEVAAAAAGTGAGVVVVGGPDPVDRELADAVVGRTRRRLPARRRADVCSLAGRLDEPALLGVLARCSVLVGNDSGPRHLAAAVGTPTVSVYWVGNAINAGPLVRAAHRVHLAWTVACPVCGAGCVTPDGYRRCEHDVSFVADVDPGPVLDDVLELLGSTRSTTVVAPPTGRSTTSPRTVAEPA
jgi:ADP-heptose:LPS heptosyltransferase